MRKMIQKVGACICCCLVCLQFVIQPALAFIPVAVGADLLYSVLASAAVTCGVTFSVIETFDPVVDAIKNKMADNGISEETIKGFIAEGTRLVFDVATGRWKTTVTMTDPLWNGINAAVRALYSAGSVDIGVVGDAALSVGYTVLYDTATGLNTLPFDVIYYSPPDGSSFKKHFYVSDGSINVLTTRLPGNSWVQSYNFGVQSFIRATLTSNNELNLKIGTKTDYTGNVTSTNYTGENVVGQIEVSSAVENPDYDWANEATNTKVVEFPSTYNGDPNDDSDENKKLVYWPDIERYLQGKNAGDLASVNPTGIEDPSAQPKPDPADSVTDYTEPPAQGSETNTSLKGLLFSKFPFCIPWDIKNAFKLLVAAPVPPAWDIDLVPAAIKQQCGITADTTWHINMDGMEVVGTVARFCSTIGFCLALAVATRKIIHS